MARIDQGCFKKMKRESSVIKNEYNSIIEKYFVDGEWNYNKEFVTDFAYDANNVYTEAINNMHNIQAQISVIKFEDDNERQKYNDYIEDMNNIKHDIVEQFGNVLELYKCSRSFEDIEQVTLDDMEIYKDNF